MGGGHKERESEVPVFKNLSLGCHRSLTHVLSFLNTLVKLCRHGLKWHVGSGSLEDTERGVGYQWLVEPKGGLKVLEQRHGAETARRAFQGTVSLAHWGIWQIIFGQSEWHSIA